MTDRLGYRIVGPCTGERRLVDWQAAFIGCASLDDRIDFNREAYLSAFTFGADFRLHLDANGTTKGFDGICGADWIWFDIDRTDLEAARRDAVRLAMQLGDRFRMTDDDLLIFFSGSKGFHLGLPTAWNPLPGPTFNRIARRFAEGLAAGASVAIDSGVYDKVRAFRAPNSKHPKTGLHKRTLTLDELIHLSVDRIQRLAASPVEFDLPEPKGGNQQAAADWQAAADAVQAEVVSLADRRATGGPTRLNRQTLDFIRDGATPGDRHRALFSAAANLAEFGCPADLAHELLTAAALDSGLSPSETKRQIDCGLNHHNKGHSSI